MAAALDAADGVIDGRYFGRPIVQQQAPLTAAQRLDAADGVIDGRFFGRQIVSQPQPVFGQQIVNYRGAFPSPYTTVPYATAAPAFSVAPQFASFAPAQQYGQQYGFTSFAPPSFGAPAFSAPAFGAPANSALNLDAADGVIDGKFFGRQIVQSPAVRTALPTASVYSVPSAPVFGGYQQFQQFSTPSFVTPGVYSQQGYFPAAASAQQSALALDAADGVIDGKFFGSRIVPGAQQRVTYGAPPVTFGGQWPASSYGYVSQAPAYSVAPSSFVSAPRFVQQQPLALPSTSPFTSNALALDAADGVIDGRYHGRPIVQANVPQGGFFPQNRSAAAQALDAADGVIDGRYHGRPIVERR